MARTTLDLKTALIVIDLPRAVFSMPPIHPAADTMRSTNQLAEAFRRHGLPLVLAPVTGAPPGRTEQAGRGGEQQPDDLAGLVADLDRQPGNHPSPSAPAARSPRPGPPATSSRSASPR